MSTPAVKTTSAAITSMRVKPPGGACLAAGRAPTSGRLHPRGTEPVEAHGVGGRTGLEARPAERAAGAREIRDPAAVEDQRVPGEVEGDEREIDPLRPSERAADPRIPGADGPELVTQRALVEAHHHRGPTPHRQHARVGQVLREDLRGTLR